MADIDQMLDQAQDTLESLADAADSAAAGGAAQQQISEATWKAIAAVEAAKSRVKGLRTELQGGDARLTAALATRTATLADVDAQRTEGTEPPLADATANALRAEVATAAGTTTSQVDGTLTDAVTAVDDAIAAIAGPTDPAVTELADAEEDLADKEQAWAEKRAAAEKVLAGAEGEPATLRAALEKALAERTEAIESVDGGDGAAAVVAYVDYQSARGTLDTASADAPGAGLTTAWQTARDEALAALGDLLQAELTLAEKQQALAERKSQIGVKQATRDADAEQAVTDALAGP